MDVTHAMLKDGSTDVIIQEGTRSQLPMAESPNKKAAPTTDAATQDGHATHVHSYNSKDVVPLRVCIAARRVKTPTVRDSRLCSDCLTLGPRTASTEPDSLHRAARKQPEKITPGGAHRLPHQCCLPRSVGRTMWLLVAGRTIRVSASSTNKMMYSKLCDTSPSLANQNFRPNNCVLLTLLQRS